MTRTEIEASGRALANQLKDEAREILPELLGMWFGAEADQ